MWGKVLEEGVLFLLNLFLLSFIKSFHLWPFYNFSPRRFSHNIVSAKISLSAVVPNTRLLLYSYTVFCPLQMFDILLIGHGRAGFLLGLVVLLVASSLGGRSHNGMALADRWMGTAAIPRVKKVVVVGGTHGNEYTGVWCIKAIDRQSRHLRKSYPSLDISTLVGNPQAFRANRRFLEDDLNRQFTAENLSKPPTSIEAQRAHELQEQLGPKPLSSSEDESETEQDDRDNNFNYQPCKTDVIIDLHSTTANMGLTFIVQEGDVLMTQAAAYAARKCKQAICLIHAQKTRALRPGLSSVAKHGFTIEVGPVPQGVLRHDAVEKTQEAIDAVLEFLHTHNQQPSKVRRQLQELYPHGKVPCYRSALASRYGEVSGKIPWPCLEDNPNFPLYMVHKSVQDKDFSIIQKGDPLFVDLDGKDIPYDGSHGSPIRIMFINEGGYYYASSGTGISVAIPANYGLESGILLDNDEDSHDSSSETHLSLDEESSLSASSSSSY